MEVVSKQRDESEATTLHNPFQVLFFILAYIGMLVVPAIAIHRMLRAGIPWWITYTLMGSICTLPSAALTMLFKHKAIKYIVLVFGIAACLVVNTLLLTVLLIEA